MLRPAAHHIVAVLGDSQRVCLVNPNELDSLCIVTVCDSRRSRVVNLQYGGQVPGCIKGTTCQVSC